MKKLSKKLFTNYLFIVFFTNTVFCQIYSPSNKDLIINKIDNRHKYEVSKINGNYKSKIKKEYKKRNKYIKEILSDSLFLFDEKYQIYLKSILKKIETANTDLNFKNYHFFFNRDPTPNAACFGNGLFMLNIGLFNFLDNEDELAFIICHEIAHQQLDHVNLGIKKRVHQFNSKNIKKKIKNAKLKTYGRTTAGLKLLKELSYGIFKNSRKKELEADSLGLLLFKKTNYNIKASSLALKRLKRVDDNGVFKTNIKLDSLLNFEKYLFKKYWLDKEETLFDVKERVNDYKWHKDSLKTHPDIDERIHYMNSLNLFDNNTPTTPFNDTQLFAQEQQIKTLLDFGQVDVALYFLLKELQTKNKINQFIIIKTAETFKKIYDLKITHKLGKKIPQTSPFSKEKNLNMIRQFLHNLEIKEVRKIGYHFCKRHKNTIPQDNKEFKLIRNYFIKLNK